MVKVKIKYKAFSQYEERRYDNVDNIRQRNIVKVECPRVRDASSPQGV